MCFASRSFLLLCLAASLPTGSGWGWEEHWNRNSEWSLQESTNCPHENPDTHVCSTLQSTNATCITVKCCSDFEEHEDFDSYDEATDDGLDENVYYFRNISNNTCSLCYTSQPCSVYRCYRRCCEGFEPDMFGRCRTIECKNGGTVQRDAMGQYSCRCLPGFEGKSCEILLRWTATVSDPITQKSSSGRSNARCYCDNGGYCAVKDGRPYCRCLSMFEGERCERPRCAMKCFSGTCVKNGSDEFCSCRDNWVGTWCDSLSRCGMECFGGTCVKNGSDEFCSCRDNWVGTWCDSLFIQPLNCPSAENHDVCRVGCTGNDECPTGSLCCREGCSFVCRQPRKDYCYYQGQRYRIGQSFQRTTCENCTCTITGEVSCFAVTCSRPVFANNQSGTIECMNGGTVQRDAMGQYNCRCPPDFEGKSCEIPRCIRACLFGTCVKNGSDEFCSCQPFFVGTRCDRLSETVRPGPETVLTTQEPRESTQLEHDDRDTPQADVPHDLMDRSMDRNHYRMIGILAPVICGLVFVGWVVLILCCLRRRRRRPRDSRSSNDSGGHPPAYDNNIYTLPVDMKVKLPPYSPRVDPPAYTVCGSIKDETYISLPPPSYKTSE